MKEIKKKKKEMNIWKKEKKYKIIYMYMTSQQRETAETKLGKYTRVIKTKNLKNNKVKISKVQCKGRKDEGQWIKKKVLEHLLQALQRWNHTGGGRGVVEFPWSWKLLSFLPFRLV